MFPGRSFLVMVMEDCHLCFFFSAFRLVFDLEELL